MILSRRPGNLAMRHAAAGGGGLNGFGVWGTFTVDHTKCGSADSTNYPVLVAGTYTWLKSVGNGGFVQNASAFDVVVYADNGAVTKLDFELVSLDLTTGKVELWLRLGTLSHTSDTLFYVGAGKASITTDQSNKTGVFRTEFKAVYHFGDGTTLVKTDTTGVSGTLVNFTTPTAAAGQIGGAVAVDSAGPDALTFGPMPTTAITNIRLSIWANLSGVSLKGHFIKIGDGSTGYGFGVGTTDNDALGNKLNGLFENVRWVNTATSIGTGWHKIAMRLDASSVPEFYLDGVSLGTFAGSNPVAPANYAAVGGCQTSGAVMARVFSSSLDEARLWSGALPSASWELAEYNNESSPSTFYSVSTV